MGYCLNKNTIIIGQPRRIFFKRQNIARLFYPLAVFACFFLMFSFALPALAIETTKASALTLEERRETYSITQSPQPKGLNFCHSFLNARLSPDAQGNKKNSSKSPRVLARVKGKNSAPLALSVYLGVRIVRGPQETTTFVQRNFQKTSYNKNAGGHPRALAIAAYRACKNEENLKRYQDTL